MGEESTEEKIKQILTNRALSILRTFLEKSHAIDCLFLLYLDYGRWGEAKSFMQSLGVTFSFRAFKSRMEELETLGLAKSVPIGPLKKHYIKTKLGEKIAKLLLTFFDQI